MDFIAGAKVSALIVETTADAIDEWVRLGMAERREGEYEKKDDGATTKSAIAELALGIGAIKEIFSNPEKVVAYGEIHNVLNNSNIWDVSKPYDWEGIYKGSYVPSITVDNLQAMAKVKTNETTHSQLSDTERQVQEMIAKGMSVEDAKLLLSAWADTQAYETSKLGSMQDDGQDPNGE